MLKTGLAILNAYIQTPASLHFYKRMKEELGSLGVALDYKTNAEILSYIASSGDLFAKETEKYDFVFADFWHDAGDGRDLMLKMKEYEKYSPESEYMYWLEDTINCYLDRELWP